MVTAVTVIGALSTFLMIGWVREETPSIRHSSQTAGQAARAPSHLLSIGTMGRGLTHKIAEGRRLVREGRLRA